ncbi:MAG: CRISPR-associated endonuclease Cas1 [Candidatus Accumulibacter phosphatis]|jgi:CRISPR-associated protein Cas1|uniref:CRISPR-associated endonuclease Cas1 n=1 Tax=Candidatus Accumulibacter phosphatis TaxID=327160 RepID=A0A080LZ63_9PROT|nr:MAG: CRISPR-associated endonuclease Cas1 [Candidatus Accumulibacter phosphatis]
MAASSLFSGRLGLAEARIPHADRHGLIWLSRGRLFVEDGTLHFVCAESDELAAGDYAIPYQNVSLILLGPGSTVSHDALRILARHGTLLAAVGEGGTKFYTAPPMGQGHSDIARAQARLWADEGERLSVARRMYAFRFGKILPHRDITVLRGIEGARMKESYKLAADRFRIPWEGRHYDRSNPNAADIPNQALNHAATFVECAAEVAIAAVGALPPLGFIHEDSSNSFTLDIADLFRSEVTIPLAFKVARKAIDAPELILERALRREAAMEFRRAKLISQMIERIKELVHVDDRGGDTKRE